MLVMLAAYTAKNRTEAVHLSCHFIHACSPHVFTRKLTCCIHVGTNKVDTSMHLRDVIRNLLAGSAMHCTAAKTRPGMYAGLKVQDQARSPSTDWEL